ncbi:MAG: PDZ domain-containing protein [Gammaproteobacteria bacterium]|nr:PDZ domain-containing protein [Gammaproteobacteria bacterium]
MSAIKPGSLFEQAGLQNGDTITEINGQPVSGPEGAPHDLHHLVDALATFRGVLNEWC